MDSIPDMILEVDSKLNIIWANKTALDLNPEAIGKACYEAFHGSIKMCEGCSCYKSLQTGKIESGIMYQQDSKSVGERYWENIGIPLQNYDNSLTSLEVSRNVTDRIHAEKEKENLIKELKSALEKVKTLTGLLPYPLILQENQR